MLCTTTATIALLLLSPLGAAEAPSLGQAVATTTTVVTAPAPGGGTTVTVTVIARQGTPSGTVTVDAGAVHLADLPLAADGSASLTTDALDDAAVHVLVAQFAGSRTHARSASAAQVLGSGLVGLPAGGPATVTVDIPTGLLAITARRDELPGPTVGSRSQVDPVRRPTGVVVQDTRAGNLGFTVAASVATTGGSGPAAHARASLVDVRATQVPGNALRAADLWTAPGRVTLTSDTAAPLATYPGGLGTGSVGVSGTVFVRALPWGGQRLRVAWTVM